MKSKVATLFVVALSLGAGGTAESEKKEVAKFAGTWTMSECKYDGEDQSKLKLKIVFKGNEGTVQGNDSVTDQYGKLKFKLDPSATPKSIDITISAGSQTDATMQGIYELKDDELRICAKVFGTGRPKEFAAPDGSSTVLLVLKKEAK
jgi:uncharacterized protein (TIGR03067 family)